MRDSVDLASARRLIGDYLRRSEGENLPLEEALFRLSNASLKAVTPQPGYDQSTRDGFVVAAGGEIGPDAERGFYIVGEIPAGATGCRRLRSGTAYRIMTGALVPNRSQRVIAQEECRVQNGYVWVPEKALQRRSPFIRRKGCEIGKGRVVVPAGTPIQPGHLVLLAATGHARVVVRRRPRVCFFCTGSELVATAAEETEGLKVSGNHYLLDGLIRLAGGIPQYLGTVADRRGDLAEAINRIDRRSVDMIITTGGVGPGKYDLLEQAFVKAGGRVIYNSLKFRPGKSTLFGLLDEALFFGLPGPPPAVSVLFNELIGPALLFQQGARRYKAREIAAILKDPMNLKETGVACAKSVMIDKDAGEASVRPAGKFEAPDGHIIFSGRRRLYKAGDRVRVHLPASVYA